MCWPAVRVRGHAGGGGGAVPAFGPAPFLLGGVGAAKGLLPCFLVPKGNQPTACTLALWWLKFGPHNVGGGGGGGAPKGPRAQPDYAVFPPQQLKNENFRS